MSDESTTDGSIHQLTGAYALDALTADERATFAAHLDECDSCAAETAELVETAARLALLTEQPAPARLRDSVLREISRTAQLPPIPAQSSNVIDLDTQRRRRRRLTAAIGGALAAAAAIAGAVFVIGDNDDPVGDILAASDARTIVGDVNGAEARLVVSDRLDGGVITFAGLPDPGAGRTYQMWLITGDAAPVPEDTFDPSDAGSASVLLEGAPDADAVAVTIEPDSGSTTPTQPILAVIQLDS
jgi:anti-sigma-K factor RskA